MTLESLHKTQSDSGGIDSGDSDFLSVGKILMETRLEQSKSLQEVSKQLRISEEYLECLEAGTLDAEIERVYYLGFLRAYAEFLGHDPEKVVTQYVSRGAPQSLVKPFVVPAAVSDEGIPKKWALFLSGFCFLFAFWGWISWPSIDPADLDQIQTDAKQLEKIQHHLPMAKASQNPDIQTIPSVDFILSDSSPLTVIADDYSWIEVRGTHGDILFTGNLEPGQHKEFPPQAGLTLSTGNAGGIVLKAGNQQTDKLGLAGEVLSKIEIKFKADNYRKSE